MKVSELASAKTVQVATSWLSDTAVADATAAVAAAAAAAAA
eukprot:CAMPEP_0172677678 /NCGR_PEP_ID=MMETSP1074-20121228/14834_1 /TAXON_ID=2916 /ORGANISM="Ceratium fusus, Strain PA161109" /LENGTH=40 /DNA_ID= /DNA_START= /DNA_END= /DNA_ORIENTATION=